jgi:hypothetical protein
MQRIGRRCGVRSGRCGVRSGRCGVRSGRHDGSDEAGRGDESERIREAIPDKSSTHTQGVEGGAEEQIYVVQQHEQTHGL